MNLVNFVESGYISLKPTRSDKIVKYKVSRCKVLIKIVEIVITIDLHVFLPYSQSLYECITKIVYTHLSFNLYGTLTCPSGSKRIY